MPKHLPKLFFVGLMLLVGSLAAGCVKAGEPITPVPPTPTVAAAIQPKHPEVAPTPTPGTRDFPLPAPTLVPVAAVARPSSQNCIDCHTDVEKIKLNAEAVEAVETQSEGEG